MVAKILLNYLYTFQILIGLPGVSYPCILWTVVYFFIVYIYTFFLFLKCYISVFFELPAYLYLIFIFHFFIHPFICVFYVVVVAYGWIFLFGQRTQMPNKLENWDLWEKRALVSTLRGIKLFNFVLCLLRFCWSVFVVSKKIFLFHCQKDVILSWTKVSYTFRPIYVR